MASEKGNEVNDAIRMWMLTVEAMLADLHVATELMTPEGKALYEQKFATLEGLRAQIPFDPDTDEDTQG